MESTSDSEFDFTELIDCFESDSEDDSDFISENIDKNNDKQSDYEFEVLNRDEIMVEMLAGVYEVVDILNVAEPFARVLLNKFKWNKQELIGKYFDTADLTKFYHEFNVTNPENLQASITKDNLTNDCGICLKTFDDTNSYNLQCGHRFCTECWVENIKKKILETGNADVIECVEHKCGALIDDQSVMELLNDSQVKQQYLKLISNTFVSCNPLFRWCKTPDCEYAIKVTKIESRSAMCKCGSEQCFKCGEIWHEPVTCKMLMEFKAMSCEDIETANWIKQNARQCPNCSINIEKNGGCNHISCKSCKHEYCWVCMGPWQGHSGCNQFKRNSQDQISNQVTFAHYNRRYLNHNQSIKVEWHLNSESKMIELEAEANLTNSDLSFFKRAVATLQRSRRILMSTYVFAYSSKQSNQLFIFEANQNDLENATEKLSQRLEEQVSYTSFSASKGNIQDLRTYCDYRQKILLDHIHEGYEKGWWG